MYDVTSKMFQTQYRQVEFGTGVDHEHTSTLHMKCCLCQQLQTWRRGKSMRLHRTNLT
jgi:hypothetical protein